MDELAAIFKLIQEAEARLLVLLDKFKENEETKAGEPDHDAVIWTSSNTGLPEQDLVHTFTGQ